ncbi:hypothetical protein RFI_14753 [Reticulomyxa filosa]|uniref:Uncharacterized protein n=1 Tax=Reticulomyxa filosa TaxID=46433 RepID=X6N845_RETFI|nr:hypothetical protein RFI_14753 [Reticulomyxa filosa]|eukprot:ETO22445.1 hypothetical protein RFI_14753 [Reticulomyxa filosa]
MTYTINKQVQQQQTTYERKKLNFVSQKEFSNYIVYVRKFIVNFCRNFLGLFLKRKKCGHLCIETSMPQSLLDDILDECDRTWAMNNATKTTNDGFSELSQDVVSRGIRQRFEGTQKKTIITTDNVMWKLANDSMRGFKHVVIEDEPEDCVEGAKIKRYEQSNDEEAENECEDENEEGKEAKHQVANHYMLDNLNQQILEHNVTPAFVSPTS